MRASVWSLVLPMCLSAIGIPAAQAQPLEPLEPPAEEQRLICAAAMRALFGKPYVYAGVGGAEEGLQLQRFRSPNGEYANSCYLAGPQVVWRTDKSPSHIKPGRWRTHPLDEKVHWTRKGDRVSITLSHSNEAIASSTYSVESLKKDAKLPR